MIPLHQGQLLHYSQGYLPTGAVTLAPGAHWPSYDREVGEYVHQVVKRLGVKLPREQVAGPLHAVPHARSSLHHTLQGNDMLGLRFHWEKKGTPCLFKVLAWLGIGQVEQRNTLLFTFALLET
jgi:hypothetical protein